MMIPVFCMFTLVFSVFINLNYMGGNLQSLVKLSELVDKDLHKG